MSIILFTGAGASKPLGYPTTIEFFEDKSFIQGQQTNIINNATTHLAQKILDVEDLLRLIEPIVDFLATNSGRFISNKLKDNWAVEIKRLVTIVHQKCFDYYGRDPGYADVVNLYRPLLNRLKWQKNSIKLFTTNYDPVTDHISELAAREQIPSFDGFNERNKWDSSKYSAVKNGLSIYRLHGSMSWILRNKQVLNTRDYSIRAAGSRIENLLIYPGFKGNPEENTNKIYSFCHNELRKELKLANILIVIGYSYRDPHLNLIFKDAFGRNNALKMFLISPNIPEGPDVGLNDIFKNKSKQFVHLKYKFGDEDLISKLPINSLN